MGMSIVLTGVCLGHLKYPRISYYVIGVFGTNNLFLAFEGHTFLLLGVKSLLLCRSHPYHYILGKIYVMNTIGFEFIYRILDN